MWRETGSRVRGLLVALPVVAIATWAFGGCGGGNDTTAAESTVSAEIVDAEALKERSEDEEMPIYWAGEQAGTELELSVPEEGRTYVRYLTGGAQAGDPQPNFLTVGTYAFAEPIPALEELAEKPGGVKRASPAAESPTSKTGRTASISPTPARKSRSRSSTRIRRGRRTRDLRRDRPDQIGRRPGAERVEAIAAMNCSCSSRLERGGLDLGGDRRRPRAPAGGRRPGDR